MTRLGPKLAYPSVTSNLDPARILARMRADYRGVISGAPSPCVPDGAPLLGNGTVGAVLTGPPERPRFHIGRNDFWSRSRRTILAVAGLELDMPGLSGAFNLVQQDVYLGQVVAGTVQGAVLVRTQTRVIAEKNIMLTSLSLQGDEPVEVDLRLRAGPFPPEAPEDDIGFPHDAPEGRLPEGSGASGRSIWVTRRSEPEGEEGHTVAVAVTLLGPDVRHRTSKDGEASMLFTQWPRQSTLICTAIVSELDEGIGDEGVADAALAMSRSVRARDEAQLDLDHQKWWRTFWRASLIEVSDPVIERYYYGALYLMACSSRSGGVAPGLVGPWTTTDRPMERGSYQLGGGYQSPWWAVFSANRPELADSYDQPLLDFVEAGTRYAQSELGRPGILLPSGIGPGGLDLWRDYAGEGQGLFRGRKSHALYCTANMILRYRHTLDADYARRVYPFLMGVADFWEAELRLEDGRYVVRDENLGEAAPAGSPSGKGVNPIVTLGLLRMFFAGMLEISGDLAVNADRREQWTDILARLSPFPVLVRDGAARFAGAESGPWSEEAGLEYPSASHGIAWPSCVVGLGSDAETLATARREGLPDIVDGTAPRGSHSAYPYAARVGLRSDIVFARLREMLDRSGNTNYMIRDGGVTCLETLGTVIATVNALLVQSHGGVIRIFPGWPMGRYARFEHLRVAGAFVVNAECMSDAVLRVQILSEKGRTCVLESPWPGKEVCVADDETEEAIPHTASGPDGDLITFETAAGRTYKIDKTDGRTQWYF